MTSRPCGPVQTFDDTKRHKVVPEKRKAKDRQRSSPDVDISCSRWGSSRQPSQAARRWERCLFLESVSTSCSLAACWITCCVPARLPSGGVASAKKRNIYVVCCMFGHVRDILLVAQDAAQGCQRLAMYVCVSMCVCVRVSMYVCIYICMYACGLPQSFVFWSVLVGR